MKQDIIAVVGLGYVGLPLAVEFGKLFTCIGYDIDNKRVDELSNGIDKTLEVDINNLKKATNIAQKIDISSSLEDNPGKKSVQKVSDFLLKTKKL